MTQPVGGLLGRGERVERLEVDALAVVAEVELGLGHFGERGRETAVIAGDLLHEHVHGHKLTAATDNAGR
ncbi:hypothetical protein, partial [Streptomyces sp. N2A]|uniref:hypothetical protein n=1 Tax=Streptomyces sp. N2A TaxID=3073936 RepID=UPI0028702127